MPFFLGYFGNNSELYEQDILRVIQENAGANESTQAKHHNLIAYASFYKDENSLVDGIIPFEDTKGLLIGKIFQQNHERITKISRIESSLLSANPTLLGQNYWGRYAGILYNETNRELMLVHDPLGLHSLFYMPTPDGIFFGNSIALLYAVILNKPSVNESFFRDYIYGSEYRLPACPLESIFELLPGKSLLIQNDNTIVECLFWDKFVTKSSLIKNEKEFEQELLKTTLASLKAWFADASGVCLELSGGCDSTGLLLALKQVLRPDQKLIAVHYIDSKNPLSNEISYAQEVSQVCEVPLYLIDWHDDQLFEDDLGGIRPNKPTNFFLSHSVEKKLRAIALQEGCSHMVNGQGGDHVFLEPFLEYALCDYWIQNGFSGSLELLKNLAWYHRISFMKLLGNNGYQFLKSKLAGNGPPAKKFQLEIIDHAVVFAQRNQKNPTSMMDHPFLFQPIVQMGFAIPTYQTFDQGYTRILFRRALSRLGKPSGLWRTQKGLTTTSLVKKFASHAPQISVLLGKGSLMKRGIINQKEIDVSLHHLSHGILEQYDVLAKMIYAQLWLDYWEF